MSPSILVLSLLLFLAAMGLAHEPQVPVVPPADIPLIQPAMPGSEAFAREFSQHWQGLVASEQMESLRKLSDHLSWLDRVNQQPIAGLGIRETAWLRWRVDQELLSLIEKVPNLITLDFRQTTYLETPTIDLNPQFGFMVVKVLRGEGPSTFITHHADLTTERNPADLQINLNPLGTTYVFLQLSDVPMGDPSLVRFIFRELQTTQPSWIWDFRFKSPPHGNLSVQIQDESGQPVSCMLRLTAKPSGRVFEPAGAADLRPLMNEITNYTIYGPGRGYTMYVPEPWRGVYWIVPRGFEMALPAGEWEIHVWRGLETAPIKQTIPVEQNQWTRTTLVSKRWTDMGKKGWYAGDDHVHCQVMSHADAEQLMAWTKAADLAVCNVLEMGDEVRNWYLQRGFGPEFRVNSGNHWIVPGQEDPRSILGHAIGLNLKTRVRHTERYLNHRLVAEEIREQGALYGHTHVGAKALFVERQMALYTPFGIVDFNSVMQAALNTDLMYLYLNLGYPMTASAGTDTPYGGTVGAVRIYAYSGANKNFIPDDWFDAVKRGRTFVTTGPMIEFTADGAMPGDTVKLENNQPVRARIAASGLVGKSSPKQVRLIFNGRVIKELSPQAAQQEVILEHELIAEYGGWLAAYVQGEDGSEAHTTPIYLQRAGFRRWDFEKVPALLKIQEATLTDIEVMVSKSLQAGDATSIDHTLRSVIVGSKVLLQQVAEARAKYQELAEIYQKELNLRQRP